MIKLGFYGAAGEVTGSCYVVTTDHARVMVDMGMHQGEKEADEHNRKMIPADLPEIDAVVLTHAHLDHCGRLPMLIKGGYRGPIYCTAATEDVTAIILRDSAHLQQEDYARFLKHIHGKPTDKDANRQPLYTADEVERTLGRMTSVGYELEQKIAEGITIKLSDAGHILGAGSVRMTVNDGTRTVVIVFSGDVGQTNAPILRDPVTPTPADVVLLESTYGDQDHRSMEATRAELLSILQAAEKTQSKVVIPAFAVGRTQDLGVPHRRIHSRRSIEAAAGVYRQPDGDVGQRSVFAVYRSLRRASDRAGQTADDAAEFSGRHLHAFGG